ncbi:MAG: hypothetical protein HUU50_21950 [Candidatus Brocadiae bacterium]|nr:hypothetical protein [Candidatus Brocadiia bacterium]
MAKKQKKVRDRAFDESWKLVLEKYFWECLDFYFPKIIAQIDKSRGYVFLEQELQRISPKSDSKKRRVDKLAKVYLKDQTEMWVLIHIEVQTYKEEEFARRMYSYHYRIWDKYEKPIASLAILADNNSQFCPKEFRLKAFGQEFMQFHFLVSKIWDWKDKEKDLKKNPNIFAIVTLASLKAYEENFASRAQWKLLLTKMLYERGYSQKEVFDLYYFLDGIMVLPEPMEIQYNNEIILLEKEATMPYITTAERIGRSEGKKEGKKEGRKEGRKEGEIKGKIEGIEAILDIKFGDQGLACMDKVQSIQDLEKLQQVFLLAKKSQSLDEFQEKIASYLV